MKETFRTSTEFSKTHRVCHSWEHTLHSLLLLFWRFVNVAWLFSKCMSRGHWFGKRPDSWYSIHSIYID